MFALVRARRLRFASSVVINGRSKGVARASALPLPSACSIFLLRRRRSLWIALAPANRSIAMVFLFPRQASPPKLPAARAQFVPNTHLVFFAQPLPQLLVLFPLRHPACFVGRFLILILPRIPARIRISRALVQPPHPSLLWFLLAFRPPPRVFVFSPWLFLLVVRPRCLPPYPISVGVHLCGVRFRFHRLS